MSQVYLECLQYMAVDEGERRVRTHTGCAHIFFILFGGTLFSFSSSASTLSPRYNVGIVAVENHTDFVKSQCGDEEKSALAYNEAEAMNQNNSNENVNKFVLQSSDIMRKRAKVWRAWSS